MRVALLLVSIGAVSRGAPAQAATDSVAAIERAEYDARLGARSVGSGAMEVFGGSVVDGHETYRAVLRIRGGVGAAQVNERLESWIDAASWRDARQIFSRRYTQDQDELGRRRRRVYEISPERRQFRRTDAGDSAAVPTEMPTDQPLDDVSMLFFARSLPLKVGDTYTIARYFKTDANPIVLHVVRRETVTVPAGTFETVVVRPTIKTSGLFGQGGKAEVFFSDDPHHTLVQLRSTVSRIGKLSLHLRSYSPPK